MNPAFNDYQVRARDFAIYKAAVNKMVDDVVAGGDSTRLRTLLCLMYSGLGLASEAGEVSSSIKKLLRDDAGEMTHPRLTSLIGELGDTQWYVSDLCTLLRVMLGDVAAANINKLRSRQERAQLSGDGDSR